jgi:hypothetical protein
MADVTEADIALTDEEYQAAVERGRIADITEPRAISARYERQSGRIIIELRSGCTFAFPARIAQGLGKATDDELAEVEVRGFGYGLRWETLDADIAVPALLRGVFGTRKYMERHFGWPVAETPTELAYVATAASDKANRRPRKAASR